MRCFKTKWFARFMRQQGLDDAALVDAIDRMRQGLVDADLGGHLFKMRIAKRGQGRSGGFRVILVYRTRERAVFVYGFAKNEKDNLSSDELAAYKMAAADYMALTNAQIIRLVAAGSLTEVVLDA